MYNRFIKGLLERFAQVYPIVGITGPRQSGKTTIARSIFSDLPYVSLENPDTRLWAQADPRAFLERYKEGAIIDEVQHVPEVLSYLQEVVDASNEKGRYVITGSQNFALNSQITQSLSGRVGMATLLPLSLNELGGEHSAYSLIFNGGYPGLHNVNMHPLEFYPSYIQTYIERDVRQIKNIENLGKFQTFLKLCAGRAGQIVNLSSLAQDCGITHPTARQWLTILEASYIVFFLQPFHKNFSKRLIKMPKMYFYDTGIACMLLGLEDVKQVESHYLRGALFENLVIVDILKQRLNKGLPPNLYFWRDRTGHEIDLIGEWGGSIHAVEIKSSLTFQKDFMKNIFYLRSLEPSIKSYVVYQAEQSGMHTDTQILGLSDLDKIQ
jgi:hypothetical protein